MNKVIEILMKRDGLTKKEAKDLVLETREMIYNSGHLSDAEDILLEQLGLEMDYIFDIL